MENTNVSWATHTMNPWVGCQKVSAGCDHCFAEALMDTRFGKVQWGPDGERKLTSDANWRKPLTWNRKAAATGERPRVFCASLADVFDNKAPEGARERLWQLIRDTPNLDWLLLTKRPQNIARMLPADWGDGWHVGKFDGYTNVWLGISAENQEEYDRRWPILARAPAFRTFVSAEPLLEPMTIIRNRLFPLPDWVIVGGESGPGFRHMEPQWARELRYDCEEYDIPYWFKQHSGLRPGQHDTLDGVRYHELPAVRVLQSPHGSKRRRRQTG